MRRLYAVLAVALVLFSATAASAIEVKVKGNWGFSYGILKNSYKYSLQNNKQADDMRGRTQDPFFATSRVRTQVDFIASKDLWGKLYFEIGKMDWGTPTDDAGKGAPLDADMVNIKIKAAFLDFRVPETDLKVRMGIQNIALPQAFGESPVFNDDVAGIALNWKINDTFGITGFWARPFDKAWNDSNTRLADENDIFGLTLPITLDGFKITPWGVYSAIGNDSGYWYYMTEETNAGAGRRKYGFDRRGGNFVSWYDGGAGLTNPYGSGGTSDAWWAGVAFKMDLLDPWTFKFDAMYGRLDGAKDAPSTKGWFLDAALSYKFDWGVPAIFGWYSTGDDGDDIGKRNADGTFTDGKGGRMPILGLDTGFAISNFGFADGYGLRGDQAAFTSGVGLWGIGLEIDKIKIWKKFSHTVRFIYARGTNDKDAARYKLDSSRTPWAPGQGNGSEFTGVDYHGFYLTPGDQYFEVNFNHFYKIYEELTLGLELGMIHLKLDEDVWDRSSRGRTYRLADTSTGWQAMLTWKYQF